MDRGSTAKWPDGAPLSELLTFVQGPDGPFLPGTTHAAGKIIDSLPELPREAVDQAVSLCMQDARARGGLRWKKGEPPATAWWGVWRDVLAVSVGRHEDGEFVGVLMTIEEARRNGAPL